jgi:hypothetical protein
MEQQVLPMQEEASGAVGPEAMEMTLMVEPLRKKIKAVEELLIPMRRQALVKVEKPKSMECAKRKRNRLENREPLIGGYSLKFYWF